MERGNLLERRAYPRLDQQVSFKLLLEGFDVESETKNISASGLYCRVSEPFSLMTKLRMIIFLPLKVNSRLITKKINCAGVVVRTEIDLEGTNHIAIFFTDIKKTDQEKITGYIKQNL